MLSTNEVNKVNELYGQIDVLTAENNANKLHQECHKAILAKLDSIEEKLDTVLGVAKKKVTPKKNL
jgi:hypothetical protein